MEEDDYMCCECGVWMPSSTVLDARRISPWGFPLSYGVAAHARRFIVLVEEHPEGWDWGWDGHPVTAASVMAQQYYAVRRAWPGDVCHACWAEWGGDMTVDEYYEIGRHDGDTVTYPPSSAASSPGAGGGAADSDGTAEY